MRNCIAPVMVFTVTLVADAIVFEASLTFIAPASPSPPPTWGNILADARGGVLAGRWWQALFPGLAIMITCLASTSSPRALPTPWPLLPPPPWRPTDSSKRPRGRPAGRRPRSLPTQPRPTSPQRLAPCAMSSSSVPTASGAHRRAAHPGGQGPLHQVPASR